MPYIQGATTDGKFFSYSVLDLMSFIGGTADGTLGDAFLNYVMYTPILIIIPVIGFFFCLFDREADYTTDARTDNVVRIGNKEYDKRYTSTGSNGILNLYARGLIYLNVDE